MDVGDKVKLEPCPMCGEEARVFQSGHYEGGGQVECVECDMNTGHRRTIQEAVAAWNRRTPSASTGEDGVPELSEGRIIALWNSTESGGMVGRYVRFARAVAREAVAADRLARQPVLDEQAGTVLVQRKKIQRHEAEIADLRAQLARQSQMQVVAYQWRPPMYASGLGGWTECTKEQFDCVGEGREARKLYAAPPLSSEPQPKKG